MDSSAMSVLALILAVVCTTLITDGIGVKCVQDITTSASRWLREKEQKSWSQEIAFLIWKASGLTSQQTSMKVAGLQTGMWNLASMCTIELRSLMFTGTTTTTRPTASAILTTGATRPRTSSCLDQWQLLASPSSQLFSDWRDSPYGWSSPQNHCILGNLAMANWPMRWYCQHVSHALNFGSWKKNIPSHLLKLDGILHHTSTNKICWIFLHL